MDSTSGMSVAADAPTQSASVETSSSTPSRASPPRQKPAALKSGHLAGAGLDIFENEPVGDRRFLTSCPTVTMTPPVAWLTPETFDRSLRIIVENCQRLKEGRSLLHEVL